MRRGGPRYSEEAARAAVSASLSYAEALRRLGMASSGNNWRTLKRYAEEVWRIPVAHFDARAAQRAALARGRKAVPPLDEILVEHSSYSRGALKKRLYEAGLKTRRCELCGQGEEWQGRTMALILDHANGVRDDNRLENLRIVCPNCAATLDTHCGRNVKPAVCELCSASFWPRDRRQRHCSRSCASRSDASVLAQRAARRVERPRYEVLLRELAENSYVAVGRRYGVSDNAIRKWVRQYERELGAAALRRAA